MPQFAFYRIGKGVESPLSIVTAESIEAAKRQAVAAIEAEELDAIRVWSGEQRTIEVQRPPRPIPIAGPSPAHDRAARMAARKAEGASHRAISEEFGISKERVRDVIAGVQHRASILDQEPNRAALSVRASNALASIIDQPETDPTERDQRLPGRVAALTRKQLRDAPNLGKSTIAEIEAWLWERGLTFMG